MIGQRKTMTPRTKQQPPAAGSASGNGSSTALEALIRQRPRLDPPQDQPPPELTDGPVPAHPPT